MSFGPVFKSPFTDLTASIVNSQMYGKCADVELDMVECLEAYGLHRGTKKCADLIADFQECVGMKKQMLRVEAMRLERHRQYYSGERDQHFAPGPREDAY